MLLIGLMIWWDISFIHDPHIAVMWLRLSLSPSLASSKWQELQRSATEGLREKKWGTVWDRNLMDIRGCNHLRSMTRRWLHNLLKKKTKSQIFMANVGCCLVWDPAAWLRVIKNEEAWKWCSNLLAQAWKPTTISHEIQKGPQQIHQDIHIVLHFRAYITYS